MNFITIPIHGKHLLYDDDIFRLLLNIKPLHLTQDSKSTSTIGYPSGQDARDKTPMYEMPPIYVFRIWGLGFGVGESIFCIGVLGIGTWSLAFCPEIQP